MRKFFVVLIILMILGGTALFFGWAQFAVPPGSWGVMRSKTHGLDRGLIREGEFRWVWYKLIPTNVEILIFSPERVECSLSSQGALPSGEVYAALAGLNANFSWEVAADIAFSIKPSSLPALVERENIGSQEDLREFAEALGDKVRDFTLHRLRFYAEDEGKLEGLLFSEGNSGPPEELAGDIYRAFPDIENLSCLIRSVRFPDFALYRSARLIYEEYLQKQREYLADGFSRSAEFRLDSQRRFDELERYGELLTKYPVLLRYLAVESGYAGSLTGD